MRHKLVERASGNEVKPGMNLLDSTNTIWVLDSFRAGTPPSTGRVTVHLADNKNVFHDFYPSVFGLVIMEKGDHE